MKTVVSIVVPVYNAGKYLHETINSVLAQTFGDWELLLVDDCSKDNSREIVESYTDERIKLVEQPQNSGAYAARNRGLKEAGGRYIAFLDADDLWEPEKLEHELKFMRENNAAFAFTGYEFANEAGVGTKAVVYVPKTLKLKQAYHNTTIFTSTVMIDRNVIPDTLIEMPNIKSEDTATWWTILKAGYIAYGLNENLVKYRRTAGTLSANKFVALKRIWRLQRDIGGLNAFCAGYHFCLWAVLAVWRRLRKG